jgi:N-acetylmuramoyl-L-alanine amidase
MNATTTIRRSLATVALATGTAVLGVSLAGTASAAPRPSTVTAAPASARTALAPAFSSCGYAVTVNGLRIRKGPGTNYLAFGQLWKYDDVMITKTSGNWAYVTVVYSRSFKYGTKGWVSRSYLTPEACTVLD